MKIKGFAIPGLLVLLLANAGCKKDDDLDIRGQWSFSSGATEHYVFTFSGTTGAGMLHEAALPAEGSGTYAVTEKNVVFTFTSTAVGGKSCDFSGSFVSDDELRGTMDFTAPYPPFAWTQEVEGYRQ